MVCQKSQKKKRNSGITNPKNSNWQIAKSLKLWSEKLMQG